MRRVYGCVLLMLLVGIGGSGCSEEEEEAETLTCEFFATDNCWRRAVTEASMCVPASEEQGMFNPELTSCTYPDGSAVTFHEPAQVPQGDEVLWDFEVSTPGGEPCMSFFDDTESGSGMVELSTASGTVTEVVSGTSLTLTCPDGTRYRGSAFALLECEGVFMDLPGSVTAWSDTFLDFSLAGTGDEAQSVFACEK